MTPTLFSLMESSASYTRRQRTGLFLGALVSVAMLLAPAPGDLEREAWLTAAVGLLMGIWWITEAIPIPATALLPLVLFPLLGILPIDEAAAPYANPLIFLFMGGFMIALAMETWQLHKRIALHIVRRVGTGPRAIILGFMIAAAFLSMWVSNTATAMMMLPIGLSIVHLVQAQGNGASPLHHGNFNIALMLGIAYACNIGGIATIIGTPPNAFLVGFLDESYDKTITFAQWMLVGLPFVLVALPLTFVVLTRLIFPVNLGGLPGGRRVVDETLGAMGRITASEVKVAVVFSAAALLWIFRPLLSGILPGLTDAGIAMTAAVALFLIPVDFRTGTFLLNWRETERLPWGLLVLFGGGLSLANAVSTTGLDEGIGSLVGALTAWPVFLLVVIVVAKIIFLTEITSNTATAAAFLPILASVAVGIGQDPLLFVVPAAIAASCAFMLPVATPPNAIVYGSGLFTIPQMAKAGLVLNLLAMGLIPLMMYWLVGWVFGVT